jgi:hypothetical protein
MDLMRLYSEFKDLRADFRDANEAPLVRLRPLESGHVIKEATDSFPLRSSYRPPLMADGATALWARAGALLLKAQEIDGRFETRWLKGRSPGHEEAAWLSLLFEWSGNQWSKCGQFLEILGPCSSSVKAIDLILTLCLCPIPSDRKDTARNIMINNCKLSIMAIDTGSVYRIADDEFGAGFSHADWACSHFRACGNSAPHLPAIRALERDFMLKISIAKTNGSRQNIRTDFEDKSQSLIRQSLLEIIDHFGAPAKPSSKPPKKPENQTPPRKRKNTTLDRGLVFEAMLILKATNEDDLANASTIARRASSAEETENVQKMLNRAKREGLVKSKTGTPAGFWLTADGVSEAESLRKKRQDETARLTHAASSTSEPSSRNSR